MTISLIIPAYNEEKYIEECLKHVYASSADGKKFDEIIVVDNGSSDSTVSIIQRFPGVRIVSEKQKGIMFARQRGFQESVGDLIAYIDADTRMPKGWVDKALYVFDGQQEVVCLSGPYTYYDITTLENFFIDTFFFISRFFYNIFGQVVIGGNFVIKRTILEKMHGMDTTISFYGDDANIGRKAQTFGKVIFDKTFIMKTSGRRLISQGLFKTFFMYAVSYFSEALFKKNLIQKYKDFR